jgi:TonB-dependent starch-binding outer membrane protein SusC
MKNKPKPNSSLLLFIMRVTLIQVFITAFTIVLANALDSNGQGVLERKVSLQMENASAKDVLSVIEERAGVRFTYRPRLLKKVKVSLNATAAPLREVLDQLFDESITYEVIGKQIVLKENAEEPVIEIATVERAVPAVQVSGTISDEAGAPLPGVNILEKGTTNGTTSDVNGKYTLSVASPGSVLIFSFIGYVTQEIAVGDRTTIDIGLQPDVSTLQEVVVVGYGEQKKATVTGAVTSVKSDQITQAPVTNLSNALAGRLPGTVFINRSGEPGYDGSQIRIRGTNTIGNPSALIVIDGIANRSGGLERLNPADIESITVLKDGSAAIYGAQAANGVILVTTKRGKAGKPEIGFNYNIGFNRPTRLPEVADAATYATMLNEIKMYQNVPASEWPAAWDALEQNGAYTTLGGTNVTATYSPTDIQKFRDGSSPWTHPNTDWYDAVIKPTSLQDMATLSLSGGTADGVTYFVSLGKMFEDGVYKKSGTKYTQYNFRSNIDAKVTKWFSLSLDLAGRQEARTYPTRGAGTIFRMLIRGKPTLPAYWPNGMPGPDIENGDNPVVISTKQTGSVQDNNYVFQSNLRGRIDVPGVKGLNVIFNAAFDEGFRPIKRFRTPWYLYTWDYKTYDAEGNGVLQKSRRGLSAPELQEEFEKTSGRTANAYVNYTKDFGPHNIALMVGTERQVLKGNQFQAFRNAYISTAVDELFAGTQNGSTNASNDVGSGKLYNRTRLNYFGRINYGFSEKYLLEMVWRFDASYIFPEESRWGFFPGVSAGWVLSEEGFMQGIEVVDRLKLRGSWGQLGNDRMDASNARNDEYQFANNFGFGGGYIFDYNVLNTTITPSAFPIANPNITWEVANNSNIGLEGTLLEGKVMFEVDYFNNIRSQMLIYRNASIPLSAGFSPPRENLGKLRNRGIDFMVGYNGQAGDFSYGIGVNGGYSKNEVLFMDEAPGSPAWQRATGKPYNTPLMYRAIGVFNDQSDLDSHPKFGGSAKLGDIIFEDVNKDGAITPDDRVRLENNTIPRFQGGITLNAAYKGFDVNILFQGATGARSYIRTQSGDFGNYLRDFTDGRWTVDNPTSEKPRTFNREDEYWISQANTYWYRNTDYLRLKNIQIGYGLPSSLVQRISLKTARIYVNAINLFTIDSFKVFDPETDNQDGTVYPQKKTYNVGVNLTF